MHLTIRKFWAKLHVHFLCFPCFHSNAALFLPDARKPPAAPAGPALRALRSCHLHLHLHLHHPTRVCDKPVTKMPSNHNVDKPWDTDDIDKWKIEPFKPEDNKAGAFTEESRFSTLFPKYREQYLKASWKAITAALAKTGIACELDLTEGSMSVFTTLKTYDPAAILNARDLIKLLARSVPAPQAIKILDDQVACGMSPPAAPPYIM